MTKLHIIIDKLRNSSYQFRIVRASDHSTIMASNIHGDMETVMCSICELQAAMRVEDATVLMEGTLLTERIELRSSTRLLH